MRVVAVIFGGPSLEHEVSVVSGRQVLEHLDRERYRALPVHLERDGAWVVDGTRHDGPLAGAAAIQAAGADIAFIALHGPFGEDGTIQGFLKTIGVPFTGSGVGGSAHARDKIRAKRLLEAYGIRGAPDLTVPPATVDDVVATLGFPVVVKNPFQGSTLGLELATDAESFAAAVGRLGADTPELLVERREAGREFTVPILDDMAGEPQVLPVIEIRAPGGFFDYESKYAPGGAEEIVPAPIDADAAAEMGALALRAHERLGLRGMSRSDFIRRDDGSLVFLETNSIPGLTPESLLPKSAAAAGIPFGTMLTRLVESALS